MHLIPIFSILALTGTVVHAAPAKTPIDDVKLANLLQASTNQSARLSGGGPYRKIGAPASLGDTPIGDTQLNASIEKMASGKFDASERANAREVAIHDRRRDNRLAKRSQWEHPGDIPITVINATPYRWHRLFAKSYQLDGWNTRWPKYIEPGQSVVHGVMGKDAIWKSHDQGDNAGEVSYEIIGASHHMAFEILYKKTSVSTFKIHVQFLEGLATKTSPKHDKILIGDDKSTWLPRSDDNHNFADAGCSFLIAGEEGNFTSTTDWYKPDQGGWMQDLLPFIGDVPLRNIVMPRSHHAALDMTKDGHKLKGISNHPGQSVTQNRPVQQQLSEEGVRVLDERVYHSNRNGFHHAHMKPPAGGGTGHGTWGRKIPDVIQAINDFQDANPGELIIWDFHANTFDFDRKNEPFSQELKNEFYELLKKGLKYVARLPEMDDYTELTLNDLVKHGKSAVILRFHGWSGLPSPKEGFVDIMNFPTTGRWSDRYGTSAVYQDQTKQMAELAGRDKPLFEMQFLRTLALLDAISLPGGLGLVDMARQFMTSFRYGLWNEMTDEKYPNWLSMDNFDGGEVKQFVIAMNKCLVAQQCGKWTGKSRF